MKKIEIYSTKVCPYCVQAKRFLDRKGYTYEEHMLDDKDPKGRDAMIERSGGYRTVPQIFVDDAHFGDEDTLFELDQQGKLQEKLGPPHKDNAA